MEQTNLGIGPVAGWVPGPLQLRGTEKASLRRMHWSRSE